MMTSMLKHVLVIWLALIGVSANAEIFQGIGPYSKLGDIKKLFPNANFQSIKPAWVQKNQAVIEMSGSGFPGKLVLVFFDTRPSFRESAEGWSETIAKMKALPPEKSNAISLAQEQFEDDLRRAKVIDDEALSISWYRWVPSESIPLDRYIKKYGKPEDLGFTEDSLQPYRAWPKRGIHVMLDESEKRVLRVEFHFTDSEFYAECKKSSTKVMFGECLMYKK